MKEITRTPQSRPAKKDRNLTRWLFVAPAMLVVLCLLVYPLCSTLMYSFTNKTLIKSTYALKGIDNYIKIFTDPAFGKAFLTTLVWTFFSLILSRVSLSVHQPLFPGDRVLCRTGSEPHQQSHSTPHLPHMYDHPLGVSLHCYRTGMEMDAQRHSGLYPHYADEAGLVRWDAAIPERP